MWEVWTRQASAIIRQAHAMGQVTRHALGKATAPGDVGIAGAQVGDGARAQAAVLQGRSDVNLRDHAARTVFADFVGDLADDATDVHQQQTLRLFTRGRRGVEDHHVPVGEHPSMELATSAARARVPRPPAVLEAPQEGSRHKATCGNHAPRLPSPKADSHLVLPLADYVSRPGSKRSGDPRAGTARSKLTGSL